MSPDNRKNHDITVAASNCIKSQEIMYSMMMNCSAKTCLLYESSHVPVGRKAMISVIKLDKRNNFSINQNHHRRSQTALTKFQFLLARFTHWPGKRVQI